MPLALAKSILADNKRNGPFIIDYLLVGGGGAGGAGTYGGGGGGGSVVTSYSTSADRITFTTNETYTITIGTGGVYTNSDTGLYGRGGLPTTIYGPDIVAIAALGGGAGGSSTRPTPYSSFATLFRDLGKAYSITNITKINSTTVEITTSSTHGITVAGNEYISIGGVSGMTQINDTSYSVSSVPNTTTVRLTTSTNSAWTAYTSGGTLYYTTYYQGGSGGGAYGSAGQYGGLAWPNWDTYGFDTIYATYPYYPGVSGPGASPFMCGTSYIGGNKWLTTSSTSFTMGNSGSQTITVGTGLTINASDTLVITHESSSGSGNVNATQNGTVTSYNSGTGSLVFTKTSYSSSFTTFNNWLVEVNPQNAGCAGGGAGGAGDRHTAGIGYSSSITGSAVDYAPGSTWDRGSSSSYGIGGAANSNGNSGVAILRINTVLYSGITTGSPTVTNDGGFVILTYTSDGTYTA